MRAHTDAEIAAHRKATKPYQQKELVVRFTGRTRNDVANAMRRLLAHMSTPAAPRLSRSEPSRSQSSFEVVR